MLSDRLPFTDHAYPAHLPAGGGVAGGSHGGLRPPWPAPSPDPNAAWWCRWVAAPARTTPDERALWW